MSKSAGEREGKEGNVKRDRHERREEKGRKEEEGERRRATNAIGIEYRNVQGVGEKEERGRKVKTRENQRKGEKRKGVAAINTIGIEHIEEGRGKREEEGKGWEGGGIFAAQWTYVFRAELA